MKPNRLAFTQKQTGRFVLDVMIIGCFLTLYYFQQQPTRILFIGNSYTYRNNMPELFENIAKANGKNVYVEHCTKGKATLFIQSKRKEVYESLRKKKWDYIIVQGSSRDLLRDTRTIQHKTLPALQKIIGEIDRTNPNATKLFYMTWGYRNGFSKEENMESYAQMTKKVRNGYLRLKELFQIGVVPVGMAWYNLRNKNNNIVLYVKDGAHPSLKGSYLTACCFYAGIFQEKAEGTNYYSKLGPKTCRILQRVASKTVLSQKKRYLLK
jgi:hypothetical protein